MIADVEQLPAAIRAAVPADRFLYALRLPAGYIVHEVTEAGRVLEREFDDDLGRFLTLDERRSRLAALSVSAARTFVAARVPVGTCHAS